MAVTGKSSQSAGPGTSATPDLTRPDSLLSWSPSVPLAFGPGPVPQFDSRKACGFIVTHVPAVGFLYGQPDNGEVRQHLEELIDEMTSYENSLKERGDSQPLLMMEDIRLNGHYCTKGQEGDDDLLYRCEVIEKMSTGKIKVFYLDYGNYEFVDPSSLFKLPTEMENKRIFLQCLIMKDVQPLFEEECKGDPYRTELFAWFRDRVSDQSVMAANVEDDNRSLVTLKQCNVNEEVKRKIRELQKKHKHSNDNGEPASPCSSASSTLSPGLSPLAANTTPVPTITLDNVSFSSELSVGAGATNDFFELMQKAVADVKIDRAKEKGGKNERALLFGSWADERQRLVMEAEVETKKRLADLCATVENAMASIVEENATNETTPKRSELQVKENGVSMSKQTEDELSSFLEVVRREKALLQREPNFMAELRSLVSQQVNRSVED